MAHKPESDAQLRIPQSDGQAPPPVAVRGPSRPAAELNVAPLTRRLSTKAERQEFFVPVSGFVWLYPEEVEVVNHPAFQRLARVYQLGQTYVVYRGATHKRIEHALGTVHIVQRMIEAVQHNSEKSSDVTALHDSEVRFVRLGAILHDIGHIAAGHTVEDELGLVGRHDSDERLKIIFEGDQWKDSKRRTLDALINSNFDLYVPTELSAKGITASVLVRLLIRKHSSGKGPDPFKSENATVEKSNFRLNVCRDMIGNTICADLLDYLYRDWYHIGKPRPFDERLLQYMEIRKRPGTSSHNGQSSYSFVISLGRRPKIRTDAISNILELLEWRYQLAESALFHRTKLAAAAMLDRALFELWGESDELVEAVILPLSDEEMVSTCLEIALKKKHDSKLSDGARRRAAIACELLEALKNRRLFAHLSTRFHGDLPPDIVAAIERTYGEDRNEPKAPPARRNVTVRLLESDFGLPEGSLVMYCPRTVNEKIAEVQIAVGEDIERFCDYERRHNDQLSGGHLDAQLRRFRRLWRVHFFIDRDVQARLGARLPLLKRAIEKLGLGHLVDDESRDQVVRSFARELTQIEDSPWKGGEVLDTAEIGAKWSSDSATGKYPLGADSIRTYIKTLK
jgi:HD superfamily phosphohydrolase